MFGPHTAPPAERFSCPIERTAEAMLLRPVGEVDLGTVPMLWSNLKAMLEDNLNVIVDLKGIQHIDSGIKALRTLISFSFQRGQRFVVSEPNAICRKLFGAEKTHPASGEIMVGGTMSMPMTWHVNDVRHGDGHTASGGTRLFAGDW